MWESWSFAKWSPSKVSASDIGKSLLYIIFTRLQGKERQYSWLGWQNESPSLDKPRSQRYCISSRWCDEIPRQTKAQLNNKTKLENVMACATELVLVLKRRSYILTDLKINVYVYSILTLLFQQLRILFAFYLRLLIFLLVKPSKKKYFFSIVFNIFFRCILC